VKYKKPKCRTARPGFFYSTSAQLRAARAAEIGGLSRRIDEIVYGLYGLTEEEIKIVEGT